MLKSNENNIDASLPDVLSFEEPIEPEVCKPIQSQKNVGTYII